MPLLGTIAITDYGWYESLSQRQYWDEVDFWTPSAHFAFRAPEFSPFLFKLKAPHNAIAGFGYFARYAALQGYLTVTPENVLQVSDRLRVDYDNGRTYYPLHGHRISLPHSPPERPDPHLLRWHNENVFLG